MKGNFQWLLCQERLLSFVLWLKAGIKENRQTAQPSRRVTSLKHVRTAWKCLQSPILSNGYSTTCRTPDHIYDLFIYLCDPFAFLIGFLFLFSAHILQSFFYLGVFFSLSDLVLSQHIASNSEILKSLTGPE